jgi:ABC-type multidrug transport system fused ATPase/permease subunit
MKFNGNLKTTLRILRDARPLWRGMALIFTLNLLAMPIALLLPYPLKLAVDAVIASHPLPWPLSGHFDSRGTLFLASLCLAQLALAFGQSFLGYATWFYQTLLMEKLILNGRSRLFRHAQGLSMRFHDGSAVGDLLFRLQNDVSSMQSIAIQGLIPFLVSLLTFCTMFAITVRIDAELGIMALGVVPLLLVVGNLHSGRIRAGWGAVRRGEQNAFGVLQEALGNVRAVQAFGRERKEQARFEAVGEQNISLFFRAMFLETAFGVFVAGALAATSAAALFLGIRHVISGALSLGDLLLVTAYLAQLYRPLETLGKQVAVSQSALASADRVYEVLDEMPDVLDPAEPVQLSRARGRIEFRDVTFRYRDGATVLQNVSFCAESGESIGIVGPSGAGKTTLTNLLMRLIEPSSGSITLDGVDLRSYKVADLRRQFAFVFQEPALFSGSIRDNIAFARDSVFHDDVVTAARAAGAHDFISALPKGYDTQLGESGSKLSGGERQRIALARAFLANAPILVLDEPTSFADLATERALSASLAKLKEGRTTFTVSHRPGILEGHDHVLRVENGQVSEEPKRAAAPLALAKEPFA